MTQESSRNLLKLRLKSRDKNNWKKTLRHSKLMTRKQSRESRNSLQQQSRMQRLRLNWKRRKLNAWQELFIAAKWRNLLSSARSKWLEQPTTNFGLNPSSSGSQLSTELLPSATFWKFVRPKRTLLNSLRHSSCQKRTEPSLSAKRATNSDHKPSLIGTMRSSLCLLKPPPSTQ